MSNIKSSEVVRFPKIQILLHWEEIISLMKASRENTLNDASNLMNFYDKIF